MFHGNTTVGRVYLEKLKNNGKKIPTMLIALRRSYIDLLCIKDNEVRWQLQSTMINLRDAIATALDKSSEEVQEAHEELVWEPAEFVNYKIESDPFQL